MAIFLLTFSVKVYAADSGSNSLPYLVNSSEFVNADGYTLSDLQEFYDNRWGNVYSLDFSSIDNLFIYETYEVIGGQTYYFTILFCPNPNYNSTYSFTLSQPYSAFNTGSDTATLSVYSYFYIQFSNYSNEYQDPYLNPNTTYSITFFGTSRNEVKYINNSLLYNADSDTPVFANAVPSVPITIGHATEPSEFDDPVYDTGHAKPDKVPQLTINNYTWTTAPTPDFSTLEDTAESIYNYLAWLGSNLIGFFSNLISNLGAIGNYIGSTIQYYGNLIISNIQNGIQNFYDNMVSLFEPIADTISKIGVIAATIVALGSDENGVFSIPVLTQTLFLPDQEDVSEIIAANDSLHIASTIDIFVDKVWVNENSIIKTLQNVPPSKKFHIPSCIYHGVQIGNFDIDFSWFEPYKTYSDIVIGSFLAIGWIYWFFVSCSHLLRYGKSYEIENGDGEQQKGIFF